MQSIDSKILSRIYGHGKGCVVTPGDFLDLGSRQAVVLVLHRLAKKGSVAPVASPSQIKIVFLWGLPKA